ncbi:MAG: delta(1)-pyrroline-2-carboxylate reductase family protein [Chloroflexia bacterium]
MELIDAERTRALLPYGELAEEIGRVLGERRAGVAYAPARVGMPLAGGGTLLLMPAADGQLGITKLVSVHPTNAGSGLTVVQAEVLAMEAGTGRRLFMLEGAVVTARRTAALSLLAARALAPVASGPLLVVGAGVQARAHLEAFVEGLAVREVYIASRNLARAEELAAHARGLGANARTVGEPGEVLERVTLVATATTSQMPVLPDGVRDDAFVAAVGAYLPDMAELPAGLVRRARVYVDTLQGARAEAGDLIMAGIDWAQVTQLEDALDAPRPEKGPVVFKSVGHALWDLAAARLAQRKLG